MPQDMREDIAALEKKKTKKKKKQKDIVEPSGGAAGEKRSGRRSVFPFSRYPDSWIRKLLTLFLGSALGMFFTSYTAEENFYKRLFSSRKRSQDIHSTAEFLDRRVANITEHFFMTRPIKRIFFVLATCPSGCYVNMFLLYAACSLISGYLSVFIRNFRVLVDNREWLGCVTMSFFQLLLEPSFYVNIFIFLFFAVAGITLRNHSINTLKRRSFLLSGIFGRLFGLEEDAPEEFYLKRAADRGESGHALYVGVRRALAVLGILLGIGTVWVSPLVYLLVGCTLLAAAIIFRNPESGVILSILLLPFITLTGSFDLIYRAYAEALSFGELLSFVGVPLWVLLGVLALTSIAYALKALRKKRSHHFRLLDGAILCYDVMILLYAILMRPTAASVVEAVLTVLLSSIYFLVVNLFRTEVWMGRLLAALQFSFFAVLSGCIAVWRFGLPQRGVFVLIHLPGEAGSIGAPFLSKEAFMVYLTLAFVLSIVSLFGSKSIGSRIWAILTLPEVLFCALVLPDKTALLMILVAAALVALYSSYRSLYLVPLIGGAGYAVYGLIPRSYFGGFSLRALCMEMAGRGLYAWDLLFGASEKLAFFGNGFGYLRYRELFLVEGKFVGINTPAEIFLLLGVPGFLATVGLVFLFFRMCFEDLRFSSFSHSTRVGVAGGLSAVSIVILYAAMYLILSFHVMFLLWLTVGMTAAYCAISSEARDLERYFQMEPQSGRSVDTVVY